MPIYEYKCTSCGHKKEVLQKMSDAPLTQCPACGKATLSKLISAAGFQLKGSGWYATDFKGGSKAAKSDQDKDSNKVNDESKSGDDGKAASESKATSESKAAGESKATSESKAAGESKAKDESKPKKEEGKPKEEPKSSTTGGSAASTPASR